VSLAHKTWLLNLHSRWHQKCPPCTAAVDTLWGPGQPRVLSAAREQQHQCRGKGFSGCALLKAWQTRQSPGQWAAWGSLWLVGQGMEEVSGGVSGKD
jgi:hypothetical protein